MRNRVALLPLICGIAVSWGASVSVAQPPGGEIDAASGLNADVAGIHKALDRLVVLLEQTREHQEIDLLLRRIEMRERRLAPTEKRLASAESDATGLESEIGHMGMMRQQQSDALDDEIRAGTDEPDSGTRKMLDELRMLQERLEAQLEEARMRVHGIEDELARGREEIEILDEMLMERLE